MISLNKDMIFTESRPGVKSRKPIQDPSHLKISEWVIDPGSIFPAHAHETDQCTYIVKGKMILVSDGQESVLEAGCYYYTPAGAVSQTKEIIEQTTMIVIAEVKK